MRRQRGMLGAVLAAAAALALPATAPAKITELGALAEGVAGSCPAPCQAVTRTTGYQAKVGPDRTLYQAPANGRIVAWTLSLGKPGPKQTAFFEENYGGTAQAAVVVLDPGRKLSRRVVAKGPLTKLTDHFGTTVQFPLERTLRIRKGQFVAITVPTWAPALQIGIGTDTSWRSSRAEDRCLDTATQSAMVGTRVEIGFPCLYRDARLTYSATFIDTPVAPSSR